ncbi:isopentenyl-diphosphate Delta-isomerase [Rouxiella badensis]|jgi:isopentenyl-diphosphate delta-isomerase|uniref:Isopentenyl-diphosphate Delta-isomerase n=1 Tax=Rouxiella badensis TaxID=1646377 RepID=A0A1X0WDF2_9GAMM|nr:isopentenyl-diphosphate Delta-isomerase [Rouxiella badensis]MCC3701337.1 isopentenyl-diphosphate Delta-isomerase [Rouxiella badensis]MCC3717764.1 isopentenyl-diphosphate Delta-isomerase [Rouxiella badensis]MCC3727292.1 isopentenyl-diphosphate Delta-isomerase [Rouxiella badensis]MCC3735015.1 isopentenyl-diphosphate Delta-isomerase [Rouxiella badensis]MCC3739107.1 isopentenyl-diphosphate Delta-isomerase [Rouxiella badensis]
MSLIIEDKVQEERLILVDEQDNKVGVGTKMQVHLQGALHRAFSVFIFDSQGRLMLQQRASGKYHSGGLWTNSCCGHPRPGESNLAASTRRLYEEMGFHCELQEVDQILYRVDVSNGLVENEFNHTFIGLFERTPELNPEEAEGWQWISVPDVFTAVEQDSSRFTAWFKVILAHFGQETIQQWASRYR